MHNIINYSSPIIDTTICGIKGIYYRIQNTIKDIIDSYIPTAYSTLFHKESREEFQSKVGMLFISIALFILGYIITAQTIIGVITPLVIGSSLIYAIAYIVHIGSEFVDQRVEQRYAYYRA